MQEGAVETAKIIKRISNAEINRQERLVLNSTYKQQSRSSVISLEVPHLDKDRNPTTNPDNCETWKTITAPNEVEEAILERNIRHFGQADGSAFTTKLMTDKFGYEGVTKYVDQLLAGDTKDIIQDNEANNGVATILLHLANQPTLPSIDDDITYHKWCQALKKWSEKTSTSPSGRHLGHYKVLFTDDSARK